MRIVLDTGVFYHPEALARPPAPRRSSWSPRWSSWSVPGNSGETAVRAFALRLIEDGYLVEPFRPSHALRYTVPLGDDRLWRKHFRDAMIAGHVAPDDELWTTNPRDVEAVGVPKVQVRRVPTPAAPTG